MSVHQHLYRRNLLPDVEPDRTWQPKVWTAFHRYLVQLEMCGYKPKEISDITGYSQNRVSIILNDPRAVEERERMASSLADVATDVHSRLRAYAGEALTEMVELMRSSTDEKVRQRSAMAILDRAGYSKYQGDHVPQQPVDDRVTQRLVGVLGELRSLGSGPGAIDASYEILENTPIQQETEETRVPPTPAFPQSDEEMLKLTSGDTIPTIDTSTFLHDLGPVKGK